MNRTFLFAQVTLLCFIIDSKHPTARNIQGFLLPSFQSWRNPPIHSLPSFSLTYMNPLAYIWWTSCPQPIKTQETSLPRGTWLLLSGAVVLFPGLLLCFFSLHTLLPIFGLQSPVWVIEGMLMTVIAFRRVWGGDAGDQVRGAGLKWEKMAMVQILPYTILIKVGKSKYI